MKSLGVWLIIFAIGSALLPYVGLQFIIVAWIGWWGPTVGWIIRAAMIALGATLIYLASRPVAPAQPSQP